MVTLTIKDVFKGALILVRSLPFGFILIRGAAVMMPDLDQNKKLEV